MDQQEQEATWRYIGRAAFLRQRKCQRIFAKNGNQNDLVLLCHLDNFYALEAWCSHQGGPLFDGDIEDFKGNPHVMCPWHGYMFDATTGKSDIGIQQKVFEVKLQDGEVFIRHTSELSLSPFT